MVQYMVKRKGLDFTEYGLVDARAAKRQRMSGENDPQYVSKQPIVLETCAAAVADFLVMCALIMLSCTST